MRRVAAVLIALLVAGGLSACSRADAADNLTLTAYFDKAVSLYESTSVRVLGLPAGKVTDIEVEGTRVKVVMDIKGDVPLPADVNATLVPLSLIGERYVQLFPAWTEGQPRVKDGDVIPLERTTIPVEPDEALAAVKKFLDTLDPQATGNLVQNLADGLEGNGAGLNQALAGIADLTTTFAEKDREIVAIVDNFDDFTATLRTRETQLGRVMDRFAELAALLADERREIEKLVSSLTDVSRTGFDLVSEHASRLDTDLTTLTNTLRSVQVNIDNVLTLLDAGPILVAGEDLDGKNEGLIAAYDPAFHHIDLRSAFTPTVAVLFNALGLDVLGICLPVDVDCVPTSSASARGPAAARSTAGAPRQIAAAPRPEAAAAPATTLAVPVSSPDTIVGVVGDRVGAQGLPVKAGAPRRSSWLARAARSFVELFG